MKKLSIAAMILIIVALLSACSPKNADIKATPAPTAAPTAEAAPTPTPVLVPADLSDALFIGDSRTVGLMDFAGIEGADFFCAEGMNVFKVCIDRISVPNVGKVTLSELLQNKSYGKIYIMLGINELGYDHKAVTDKYKSIVDGIAAAQPEAKIFIMANLHVSAKRSESDKYFNNPAINELNSTLAGFADGKSVFYMDANPVFDDPGGNLASDNTPDGTHLNVGLYPQWADWIRTETAKLI